MAIPLPFETERLLIRVFVPDADASSMVRVYGDAHVMRFIPGGAIVDEAATRKLLEALDTYEGSRELWAQFSSTR